MKGGFINPPNETRKFAVVNHVNRFNEGRVYKPAERLTAGG